MSSGPQFQDWDLLLTCLKQTSMAVTDLKKLLYIQQHSCGQTDSTQEMGSSSL